MQRQVANYCQSTMSDWFFIMQQPHKNIRVTRVGVSVEETVAGIAVALGAFLFLSLRTVCVPLSLYCEAEPEPTYQVEDSKLKVCAQ